MKLIKPISLVLSLVAIFSLSMLNNDKVISANESDKNNNVVYETNFEGMNVSSSSTVDKNTGFIWSNDWENTKTVKRKNSTMLDMSVKNSSTYSTVGGFGIGEKSNLAKCRNGEAYDVSTYLEMENIQFMFVEFVGGTGKWGSVKIYPNGDVKENVGGTNMSNVSYVNNILRFTFTMSFNGDENVNGYIKFTAYNASSAHVYLDDVSITRAKYMMNDGFESMPVGVFDTHQEGLHANFYAEGMTRSEFIRENNDTKAKMSFTLSQNTAGEAVFYINKLGFLNKNRVYDMSFDMETSNIEELWIYHGGTWMSPVSYAQINVNTNAVSLYGNVIKSLTYSNNKVNMNFSTENVSGDWMQFQIIAKVKEVNKISSVILDNMVVEQQATISKLSLDISDVKIKYYYGEDLDLSNLVVNAIYSNESIEKIDVSNCKVTGYNPHQVGKQQLTITYKDVSETFEIIVSRKVESISINKEELKVSYNYGEEIDLSNLVVKITYVDSGESDILNHGAALGGYAIDLGNFDPYAPGKYTITVYYLNVNTTFEVEVKSNGNISFDDVTYEETGK